MRVRERGKQFEREREREREKAREKEKKRERERERERESKTLSLYIVQFLSVFHYLLPCSRIIINKVNIYMQHLQGLRITKINEKPDVFLIAIYCEVSCGALKNKGRPRPLFFLDKLFSFLCKWQAKMIRTRIRGKKKKRKKNGARYTVSRHSSLVKTTRNCRCANPRRPKTSPRFARLSRSSRNRQILELYIYAIFFSLRDCFRIFSCDPSEPIVEEPVDNEIDHEEQRRGEMRNVEKGQEQSSCK